MSEENYALRRNPYDIKTNLFCTMVLTLNKDFVQFRLRCHLELPGSFIVCNVYFLRKLHEDADKLQSAKRRGLFSYLKTVLNVRNNFHFEHYYCRWQTFYSSTKACEDQVVWGLQFFGARSAYQGWVGLASLRINS